MQPTCRTATCRTWLSADTHGWGWKYTKFTLFLKSIIFIAQNIKSAHFAFCGTPHFVFCFAEPLVRRNEIQTELSLSNARKVFLHKVIFFRNRGPPPSNLAAPQKKTLSKGSAKKKQAICGFFTAEPLFREIHGKSVFFCGTPSWVFFCETPFSTPVSILTFDTRIFVGIDYDVRFAVD